MDLLAVEGEVGTGVVEASTGAASEDFDTAGIELDAAAAAAAAVAAANAAGEAVEDGDAGDVGELTEADLGGVDAVGGNGEEGLVGSAAGTETETGAGVVAVGCSMTSIESVLVKTGFGWSSIIGEEENSGALTTTGSVEVAEDGAEVPPVLVALPVDNGAEDGAEREGESSTAMTELTAASKLETVCVSLSTSGRISISWSVDLLNEES